MLSFASRAQVPQALPERGACAVSDVRQTWTEVKKSPNEKVTWQAVTSGGKVKSFVISRVRRNGETQLVTNVTDFGVLTKDGEGENLILADVSETRPVMEDYVMLAGKRRHCTNSGNEVVYTFKDSLGREQRMRVRLYDDGIAFRYELDSLQHTLVYGERTTYRIAEGTRRWMQKWTESYEEFFPLTATGEGQNRHWGYPALLQSADDVWTLITEAGIERNHSASSLYNDRAATDYRVVPDENVQNTTGRWQSPWRVLITGELKDVVQSTLVTDVSAPCRVKDTTWIKPGGVSWIYWAYNHGSSDFQIVKKYVDMAATLHLPYVLIDAEWDEMHNGGTIDDALRYAREKGVKPLLWYNSSTAWLKKWGAPGPHERLNAPENREKEFAWLEKNGVAGVKIDFFAGDKQPTMEYCIDILESAARHHLLVNFHGATTPRGWQRTYPNLMSTEGVYGEEWYNNLPTLTEKAAAHNATLPFTRNVVGSMDYTPCAFSDSQHPHITTNAHELALAVLFESALLHWADRPESYLAQPEAVKTFIGDLPTAWDETRFLSGYPAESVVMARRKGDVWYVAGINGRDTVQTLTWDSGFLPRGRHSVQMFEDSGNAEKPWKISEKKTTGVPNKILLQPRGGFVMVVR